MAILQLERALNGHPQLLQALLPTTEVSMEPPANEVEHLEHPLAASSTAELMGKLAAQSAALVEKQIALAKAEVKDDLRSEIEAAEGFGVAGICALTVLNLLLVAVVLALSAAMPSWLAALIVAGVMLLLAAIAALVGRGKLVTKPLAKSRRILEEDAHWVKERI